MPQERIPKIFLSFSGMDADWVAEFKDSDKFTGPLKGFRVHSYKIAPEMLGPLTPAMEAEIDGSDVFIAFLSSSYVLRDLPTDKDPLTVREFKYAFDKQKSKSRMSRLIFALVILDQSGRDWWEEFGKNQDDIPENLGEKSYFDAMHKDGNRPCDFDYGLKYKILQFAVQINKAWTSAPKPPPKSDEQQPREREIILVGHPGLESSAEVVQGLDDLHDAITEHGRSCERWPDRWSPPSVAVDAQLSCSSPAKIRSLISRGSVFVRAVGAREAYYVALNGVDPKNELLKAAELENPTSHSNNKMLAKSELAVWLPSNVTCEAFTDKISVFGERLSEDTVLRADNPSRMAEWLIRDKGWGSIPPIAMEFVEQSGPVKSLLQRLLTVSLGSSSCEQDSPEFEVFQSEALLSQALSYTAGRSIMVAHDLREDFTRDRRRARAALTGKLKPLWKTAQKTCGGGHTEPFLIAMISTFFEHFATLEYPRPEAGPWHILRCRARLDHTGNAAPVVEEDELTWNPLVKALSIWLRNGRDNGDVSSGLAGGV